MGGGFGAGREAFLTWEGIMGAIIFFNHEKKLAPAQAGGTKITNFFFFRGYGFFSFPWSLSGNAYSQIMDIPCP